MINLIKRTIRSMKLPPHVKHEDLYAYGWEGYSKAVKTHDPSCSVTFDDYAYWKIKYAVIEGLRRENPSVRAIVKLNRARSFLAKAGMESDRDSLLGELGVGTKTLDRWLSIEKGMISIGDHDEIPFFDKGFEVMDARILLSFGFSKLNSKELSVIWMHFFRGDKLSDIGRNMRISESRVCQLKSNALDKMRKAMTYDEV
tara:strand:- start:810 stop:1409 length:600 start_codon:yes stop_codon:yes gene_type:complete